jgi:guanosine-3',5'-bis(diphosphate) 3'-pyrophosphohydrolase
MESHIPAISTGPMGATAASLLLAVETATRAHAGILREGDAPLPYATHAIEVMINLRYVGGVTDPEMLCAAALHDTVEGDALTLDQIEKYFGERVRSLVGELTRTEPSAVQIANLPKDEVWQLRADMLVDEISKMSPNAQQIKLADRLANVREAHRAKRGKKLRRYLSQTKQILQVVPRSRNKSLWDAIKAELD